MGLRVRRLGVIVWLAGTISAQASAQAQVAPVSVPKGVLRVAADGLFETFDERFRNGQRESYAADLSSPALGSDRIPTLAEIDTRLRRITGTTDLQLNLGHLSTDAAVDVTTAVLGLDYGITNRLTIFGRLPLTRNRVQSTSRLDPTNANAGFAPLVDQQVTFFQQFQTALGMLNTKLTAGDYDANPTKKALAQATLTNGTTLYNDLFAILGDPSPSAPFAPTSTSAAGTAVAAQINALQNTLNNDLSVTGFAMEPTLPSQALTSDEFESYLRDGLGYRTGQTELRFRGDAEAGLALTFVDTWTRNEFQSGFRTALSALARFPTGVRDRPDRLLDLGTGDGQTDIEIGLVTDVAGGHWGARLTGTYTRQLPADIVQRVTSPSQPFVGPERLAVVRWDPGDVVAVGVRPFYRMTTTLALQVGADHWRRGVDQVSYANSAAAIPGVEASVLATDSKASATLISAGITYAHPGHSGRGGQGLPVEASWMFERVVRSGEGRVPAVQGVRASFRVYFQLFK